MQADRKSCYATELHSRSFPLNYIIFVPIIVNVHNDFTLGCKIVCYAFFSKTLSFCGSNKVSMPHIVSCNISRSFYLPCFFKHRTSNSFGATLFILFLGGGCFWFFFCDETGPRCGIWTPEAQLCHMSVCCPQDYHANHIVHSWSKLMSVWVIRTTSWIETCHICVCNTCELSLLSSGVTNIFCYFN